MKGYWHIPALAAAGAFVSIRYQTVLIFILFVVWLIAMLKWNRLTIVPVVVSISSFLIFFLYFPHPHPSLPIDQTAKSEHANLSGKIVSSLNITPQMASFVLKEQPSALKTQVIFFINNLSETEINAIKNKVRRGSVCRLNGKLRIPSRSTNPGEFNFQQYLWEQGITRQLEVAKPGDIYCAGESIWHKLDAFRMFLLDRTGDIYSDTTAWLKALVLGDDHDIPEETVSLFQAWGLSHLLAISGLHVGLIIGLIYMLLIKTGVTTVEGAKWFVILFLPIYCVLAGAQPSVMRASIMGVLLIVLTKISRNVNLSDVLSIAFLVLVCWDKYIVTHVGFQLSFLVTFSLILSGAWLKKSNALWHQMLCISFISQMAILPVQMVYFSTFQPLSILLNVLVVPYFSFFVIPLMFILLLIPPIPFISSGLDVLFEMIHRCFLHLLSYIENVSFPWINGEFPSWAQLLYYGFLVLLMVCLQKEKLKQAFLSGILLITVVMAVMIRPYISPYGSLTMMDIGQGDAFILELPYRQGVFMIDAGAKFSFEDHTATDSIYKQILKAYLYKKGITTIDGIFISHEDMDHAGSVAFLLNDFQVENLIISPYYPLDVQQIQKTRNNKTRIIQVKQGQQITLAGQAFTILSPMEKTTDSNENSLVFWTSFGGKSWLFTGDAGKETEKKIMQAYPNLTADVLKLGHHGSKNSSDEQFIRQLGAQFALISAGRNNRYGHPHQEVLDLLSEHHIHILRTDKQGAIIYRFNGERGTFFSFLP
ncbi:DNA internalization-related competence protein ComEC/Rec2 [Virgibacillus sp. 179-BFC.A HS]|uniref:DNA internalization-related competence protein ComEC/Rec2 n=1 Tax=Tigheibacillus jepli TaxID=3035914 RepID=A0ABU5CGR5_9BACI|nr:DNA internalization-related competence protein ComEC/Rec2 [Virgibacillus sp. 179-BFC.A HS]MDY0405516.1 DNA internalization-related competence protein ComEC/Rec2 [Virgibacillus sp. 179-BFC.A HS]